MSVKIQDDKISTLVQTLEQIKISTLRDLHFKAKTSFSYKQKDIRRILSIAVKQFENKIQARLSKGLDFRTYGEKALYFNGNYYSMRIESNGRIHSFHPNE